MTSWFGLPASANPIARRAAIAVVLLLAGLALAAAFRVISGTEHQAFAVGAVPPSSTPVTEGKTYELSVPGGVPALKKKGVDVTTAQCAWSVAGSGSQVLEVAASGADTKAINTVGTFVSPVNGSIHVDCAGWGPMYIDDADNTPSDVAGWCLVLGVIALAVGAGLGVSAMRMASEASARSRAARDDEQVERLVHVAPGGGKDDEVLDSHGGDVSP